MSIAVRRRSKKNRLAMRLRHDDGKEKPRIANPVNPFSVTKSPARVLAPEVHLNSISPGVVNTRWVEGHEEHVERLASGTSLGRVPVPEDGAGVAYALLPFPDS
ncbi:hypothetical protein BSNK01_08240 [Bacillaceae bacterium]